MRDVAFTKIRVGDQTVSRSRADDFTRPHYACECGRDKDEKRQGDLLMMHEEDAVVVEKL